MTQTELRAPVSARRNRRHLSILIVLAVMAAFGLASSVVYPTLTPAGAEHLSASDQRGVAVSAPTTKASGWPANTDPRYYPLRDQIEVDCSYRNCTNGTYHPYWAIDLVGRPGDPVYPAGSGVVHIGSRAYRCVARGNTRYTPWLWVDHGGGILTKYRHITNISVREGQRVTPNTRLGTLSHGGSQPCDNFYLHFEVRRDSVLGDRQVDPGQLRACVNNERVTFPRAIPPGYGSWRAMPTVAGRRKLASSQGVGCWGPPGPLPGRPSIASIRHGTSSISVAWRRAPAAVNGVVVSMQIFHKSTGRFANPVFRRLGDDVTRTTFSGLRSGRPYRFRLAFHNTTGWSVWSPTREYMFPRQ